MPWALGCVSREGGRVAIDLHPRGAVARVERGERGRNELKGIFEGTFKRVAIFSNRRDLSTTCSSSNPTILIQCPRGVHT